jgi:hypothetical protein
VQRAAGLGLATGELAELFAIDDAIAPEVAGADRVGDLPVAKVSLVPGSA